MAGFAALLLVPPSVRIASTGDIAWCRSLGLEWREPVSLSRTLTDSQIDAVTHYVAEGGLADEVAAQARVATACTDARQDRQTLIVVVGFVVLGWLVVSRGSTSSRSSRTDDDVRSERLDGDVA
ncbi:hypothetical protein ACT17Q_00595 [Cellulomonas sp. CW35]|uniref:hypothetical protein n=1 Tax=Cellulomonas sp. CW35 TaxID=3458249 RepID=UPI004034A2FC